MNTHESILKLPAKIPGYLGFLGRNYEKNGQILLSAIIKKSTASITERYESDNLDGGIHGHAITLTLNEDLFGQIFGKKDGLRERIKVDLNRMANTRNEYISEVFTDFTRH